MGVKMSQALIEKVAQRFAVDLPADRVVRSGDFLSIRPAHVMTHDNTSAVIAKFKSMGAAKIHDPRQPVFGLDHDIQNTSAENLGKYATIQRFAAEQGVAFYPAGRGIAHQVMVEEGYVLPGSFVVGSDSHSNLYGALGALGTPVVRTDAAAIWATGRTWWQVPEIVRVTLTGKLAPGVVGKDVIVALCGVFKNDEVLNCVIEFAGEGAAALSIEERMTISNMTTEWGALAGVFPYDGVTREYLLKRAEVLARKPGTGNREGGTGNGERGTGTRGGEAIAEPSGSEPRPSGSGVAAAPRGDRRAPRLTRERIDQIESDLPVADADAEYAKELTLDLAAVTPFASGPNTVKTITAVPELERQGVKIDKAYLMSCVNARLQDFEAAAAVIKGRKVADGVEFYIAAASDEVERLAKERGYWQTLVDSGAIELPPGCGACIGLGRGTLEDGEVGISATNRNFKGRMGSREANVYLASPAVVAASAVAGKIAAPHGGEGAGRGAQGAEDAYETMRAASSCEVMKRAQPAAAVKILPGFPERIEGELLFVPADNLNTDGIYGKDYTYKEGMTPEQMAAVAMENYDPQFQQIAREGDILIGGYNFGSGSSREQAATALKYRGLQMIIAGSYSQTYKRNAFNNGYVCIECPELVDKLKAAFAEDAAGKRPTPPLTIRTGRRVVVDFTKSEIVVSDEATERRSDEGHVAAAPRGGRGGKKESRAYSFAPLGEVAQELIVQGGFEAVIRGQLAGASN
jgi:homoaconitate hydratase